MSRNYVIDNEFIISVEGIRTVSKTEYISVAQGFEKYYLEVEYKGLSKKFVYAEKDKRDKTFDEIVSRLNFKPAITYNKM